MFCYQDAARRVPGNYLLLGGFTVCLSYMVGYIASSYGTQTVFMAAIMTLALTISLTIYAFTTKTDYTYLGATLFILACGLIMFGLFAFVFQYELMVTTWSILGVILYSYYLVYDTQLIAGGCHRHFTLSLDDYVIAALIIYIDVIILFLRILEIVGQFAK